MPRVLPVLVAAVLLFALPARAQLSGTYTLGPSPGNDFSNVEDAAAALSDLGVDGPVVIEIEQATYNERIDLGSIPGASATNTITFRGIPTPGPTLPLITYTPSAGEPNVVHLAKADWVRLESLRFEVTNRNQSFGTVIRIDADDVIVSDCQIRSIDDAAVGANDAVGIDVNGNRVTVQDTDVDEGDIGIRYGLGLNGPTSGGQILRNTLDRNVSGGILVEDQAIASGNAVSIRENQVIQNATDVPGWVGIWVRNHTQGAVLASNQVFARSGLGIRIENVTIPSTNYVSVVNNMVSGSFFGIQPGSGIEILNTDRARVQNNTVVLEDEDGTVLRVDAASTSTDVRNNIFVHEGSGFLVDIESEDAILAMDYQAYESPNEPTQFRARWMGVVYTDFPTFVATAGRDDHGIVWPVEFHRTGFPHLGGRSDGDGRLIGTPLPSSVPSDFDGDPRSATRPYRGADEAATPLMDPPPFMSGSYSIDSAGRGDYVTFAAALADLDLRGVNAPVTFTVTGLFNERIDLGPVPGASATKLITFTGPSGGSPGRIHNTAGSSPLNYTLRLTDVQFAVFHRLAFRSQGTNYADVVVVEGGRHITFDDCEFIADTPNPVGTLLSIGGSLLRSAGNAEYVHVLNSTFSGGLRAIYANAISSGPFRKTGGHEIIDNTISNLRTPTTSAQITGIKIGNNTAAVVRGNRVAAPLSNDNFVGIDIGDSFAQSPVDDIIVEQNVVVAQNGTGISWERFFVHHSVYPDVVLRLVNNTVRMSGNGPTIGLMVTDARDLLTAHNTVSISSTDPASAAGQTNIVTSSILPELDLRNNIFQANLGRALDLHVSSTSTSQYTYDYNVLASNGTALATYQVGTFFTGDCPDLACIQAASGSADQDNHTIVKTVAFADAAAGDLHLDPSMDGDLDLTAVLLSDVPADIDGEARSATRPYRGADERPTGLGFITVSPQVFLQGAYPTTPQVDGFGDAMRTTLGASGLIPLSNPYAAPAFDGTVNEYDGTESVDQAFLDANPSIVDWVIVGLRETPTGPDVLKRAVFLRNGGSLLDPDGSFGARFGNTAAGTYYVVVYHRTHLPVMSAQAFAFTESNTPRRMYRADEIYGGATGAALLEDATLDVFGMVAGDGNADGSVLADDRQAVWLPQVGQSGYLTGDFSLDGNVLADDRQALWAPNVGRQSNVPGASLRAPATTVADR